MNDYTFPGPDLTDHLTLPFVDLVHACGTDAATASQFGQAAAITGSR